MDGISQGSKCVTALFCLIFSAVTALSQSGPARQQEISQHFGRAQDALKSGKTETAIREFRAVLAIEADNVDAIANLGVIAFVQGDYRQAAEHFRRVVKIQPSLSKAEAMLGMCEKRLGNSRAARSLLENSFPHIQEKKLRTQVGLDLVELGYQDGDVTKTVELLQALQQIDPTNEGVLYAAYRIFSALASHAMDGIALTNPGSARMHQIMAQHLVNNGDIPGAIAQYRTALNLDPNLSGAHFELGEAILQDSRSASAMAQAQREFEAAVAGNPYDAKPECWLGHISASNQDLTSALKHYTRSLELSPNEIDAQLGIAKVLTSMDQPEKALPHLQAALRVDPLNANAHYRLSAVYRRLGRTLDAQREALAFSEIRERKKRIMAAYQQMHQSAGASMLSDPDIPQ